MNIYESSKDYVDNTILLLFDGEFNQKDVIDYISDNYNCKCKIVSKSMPKKFRNFENCGTVIVKCI